MSDNIKPGFEAELTQLLNRWSKENESNTPDYILAHYLIGCLRAFNVATNTRTLRIMGVLPEDEKQDYQSPDYMICESCTKQCPDIQSMRQDGGSNWFCQDCWEELAPVMRRDYKQLKEKGEL